MKIRADEVLFPSAAFQPNGPIVLGIKWLWPAWILLAETQDHTSDDRPPPGTRFAADFA